MTDVLARDTEFTISQINGPRFEFLGAPFILGLDRGPQYLREEALLRSVVRDGDLETIRGFAAQTAAELVEAARLRGRIDVAGASPGWSRRGWWRAISA